MVAEKLGKGYIEAPAGVDGHAPPIRTAVAPRPGRLAARPPVLGGPRAPEPPGARAAGAAEGDAVVRAWERIEACVAANVPRSERRRVLPAGVPAADLARIERAGRVFSGGRVSYRRHDGFPHARGEEILPLGFVGREWKMRKQMLDRGEHAQRDYVTHGPVQPVWWCPGWIPVTHDGAGNGACIDLDPAPGGTPGQVVDFAHGPERRVLAKSFAAWLTQLAEDLESGRWRWSEDDEGPEEVCDETEARARAVPRGLVPLLEHSWNTVFQVAVSPDGRLSYPD